MLRYLRRMRAVPRDRGASAVEYGLLVAGIAALVVIVVFGLGGVIQNAFQHTCSTIVNAGTPTPSTCPT
jgi:pilus assembly protein Flp/PilA